MRVSPAPWGNLRRLKSVPRGVGHAAFKRLVGLERAYPWRRLAEYAEIHAEEACVRRVEPVRFEVMAADEGRRQRGQDGIRTCKVVSSNATREGCGVCQPKMCVP